MGCTDDVVNVVPWLSLETFSDMQTLKKCVIYKPEHEFRKSHMTK